MNNSGKQQSRRSATMRITIAAMLFTLLLGAAVVVFSYFMYRGSATGSYADRVVSIADALASIIDTELFVPSAAADAPDEYWHVVYEQVSAMFARVEGLAYLYVMVPYRDGLFKYYVSTDIPRGFMVPEEDAELYAADVPDAIRERRTVSTGIADAGEYGILISAFAPIIDGRGAVVGIVGADIYADAVARATNRFIAWLALFVVAGALLAGIVLRLRIMRTLSYSLHRIVELDSGFADTSVQFKSRARDVFSKDVIDRLYSKFSEMMNGFQLVLLDIDALSRNHIAGFYKSRLDESKFSGGNQVLAKQMNAMLDYYVNDRLAVFEMLDQYKEGRFDYQMDAFESDWAFANGIVSGMRENLVNVAAETRRMIEAAADKGDLNFQIDADKYKGSWREIMRGLNRIAEAVNAPVVDIRESMLRLGEGHFDRKVTGSYRGDFHAIKEAVNTTISNIENVIGEISAALTAMAGGDMTLRITSSYPGKLAVIKDAINNISETLHKTIGEITTASAQVLSGAKQISASAMDLAGGATEQASSVEELNASIDMISQQTRQNAESAREAAGLSQKSTENAHQGNETMKQMLTAMEQIKESSGEISKIIKNIEEITFQTNLLSLNASVEAARAGEHGRGFAVVADEVRNLANKSQQSTVETTALINDSITRVDAGSAIAQATGESLSVIVKNAAEIMDIINAISNSSKEQAEAIGQISGGLVQISSVVQSNSAVSEEAAAAAEELNSQAELLQQLVSYFKL